MAVSVAGSQVSADVRERVEQFLFREADLLDTWDLEGWLNLFTEDCLYWVPVASDDYDQQDEPSLLQADRQLLRDLVDRLESPFAHSQTPRSRLKRIVGNIRVRQESDDQLRVLSNFILCEARYLSHERMLAGTYEHLLVVGEEPWKIKFKKASLIISHQAMYNLSMFFI